MSTEQGAGGGDRDSDLDSAVWAVINEKVDGPQLKSAIEAAVALRGEQALREWRDSGKHGMTLLHYMVQKGNISAVRQLAAMGCDLNSQRVSDKCTPLHLAGWYKQPMAVDVLVRLGADTTITNGYGYPSVAVDPAILAMT